ncbi:MAG: Na+/H+ antiporter subunit E [Microcella sp.]|uniref:Na+/H+ antiporter subunit E n=1 Tax=Microcella sp. TaxID=1913979 RepID=UPI0024CB24E7|nr:Na+/H+ antiporter subunit E [Microcella sp.]UYN82497.1 MAG: Na+/H+ antiporter subunit E [Microcella sp.]
MIEANVSPDAPPRRRVTLLEQVPLLLALVALWIMLWGSVTPLTIVTGVVVALAVTRVFYLPPVELSGRFNVFWFVVFVMRVLGEIVVASFQVALQAFAREPMPYSAVIRIDLHTRSDFIMTGTTIAVSVVPGSVVLEIDRVNARLYVHTLGARTDDDIDKARAHVLSLERDLLRAWGSADEWKAVR